jgi:D-sedoheptulose 7-phosphate isomerase
MVSSLMKNYPLLESCKLEIEKAAQLMISCYEKGNKILICGNGGSAADSEHIVGELMKGFLMRRSLSNEKKAELKLSCPEISDELLSQLQGALPAISLTGSYAFSTAFSNDVNPNYVFAQQVFGLGKKGDVLIGISTSGNSVNVVEACKIAKGVGMQVIGLTGMNGGKLKELSDVAILVPAIITYQVQELHLPIYHALCALVEEYFFK